MSAAPAAHDGRRRDGGGRPHRTTGAAAAHDGAWATDAAAGDSAGGGASKSDHAAPEESHNEPVADARAAGGRRAGVHARGEALTLRQPESRAAQRGVAGRCVEACGARERGFPRRLVARFADAGRPVRCDPAAPRLCCGRRRRRQGQGKGADGGRGVSHALWLGAARDDGGCSDGRVCPRAHTGSRTATTTAAATTTTTRGDGATARLARGRVAPAPARLARRVRAAGERQR